MTSSYRKLKVSEVPCQEKKKASGVKSIRNLSIRYNSPPSKTSYLNGLVVMVVLDSGVFIVWEILWCRDGKEIGSGVWSCGRRK